MAAPSITLGTPYFSATALSSHTVNLPAGTAYKGVWICTYGASTNTVSGPAGWTLKLTVASTGARKLSLLTSDATTSATSVAIATSTTTNGSAQGFSTDGNLSAVVTPTGVVSSGTNPDPPASGALTSGDYRIMALCGYFDARRAVTAYPSSYADNQANVKGTLQNEGSLGLATRGMTGITAEDAGTFTLAGSIAWVSATAAIPAATVTSWTGTIASTLDPVVADLDGTVDNGDFFTGTIASVLDVVTADLDGTFTTAPLPGDIPTAAVIAIYDARTLAGAVNDPVASWPDSGPLSQTALTQATSGNRPVIDDSGFGGIRSVKFDGVNDVLTHTALASTYTGDFAFLIVKELLTYPTGTAAVFYSCDAIPNKHICGYDDVEDPPGWVIMSSNDGTQAQHHHGTADQAYVEATPSRFVTVQLVRNAGEHKFWENGNLVTHLTDSSGEDSDLNNLTKLKLGAREDNSRYVNGRIAYFMVIDMAFTDEATLLDARDELGQTFAVPGFEETAWTGTIVTTLGDVVADLDGTFTPPPITGTIASTLEVVTADLDGTVTAPVFTGVIGSVLDPVLADLDGTRTLPVFTGALSGTLGPVTAALSGTSGVPTFSGTIASTLDPVVADLDGTFTPVFTGTITSTLSVVTAVLTGTATPPVFAGTIASVLGPVTPVLSGTATPPVFAGPIATTLDAVVADLDGTRTIPTFTGAIASTLDSVVADLDGSRTIPSGSAILDGRFDPVVAVLSGTFKPVYSGAIAVTLGTVTADLDGTFDSPGFDGNIVATFGAVTAVLTGSVVPPTYTGTLLALLASVTANLVGTATGVPSEGVPSVIRTQEGPVILRTPSVV